MALFRLIWQIRRAQPRHAIPWEDS
jgi:hypothetical protein